MSENMPLKKKTRAELLEMLVEQSKAVAEIKKQNERLEKELLEKEEAIELLKKELKEKDVLIEQKVRPLQEKLKKSIARNKALKEAAEMEHRIHQRPLTEAKTVSEASLYMNQVLASTRKTVAEYQKLVLKLAKEAKKHE